MGTHYNHYISAITFLIFMAECNGNAMAVQCKSLPNLYAVYRTFPPFVMDKPEYHEKHQKPKVKRSGDKARGMDNNNDTFDGVMYRVIRKLAKECCHKEIQLNMVSDSAHLSPSLNWTFWMPFTIDQSSVAIYSAMPDMAFLPIVDTPGKESYQYTIFISIICNQSV